MLTALNMFPYINVSFWNLKKIQLQSSHWIGQDLQQTVRNISVIDIYIHVRQLRLAQPCILHCFFYSYTVFKVFSFFSACLVKLCCLSLTPPSSIKNVCIWSISLTKSFTFALSVCNESQATKMINVITSLQKLVSRSAVQIHSLFISFRDSCQVCSLFVKWAEYISLLLLVKCKRRKHCKRKTGINIWWEYQLLWASLGFAFVVYFAIKLLRQCFDDEMVINGEL